VIALARHAQVNPRSSADRPAANNNGSDTEPHCVGLDASERSPTNPKAGHGRCLRCGRRRLVRGRVSGSAPFQTDVSVVVRPTVGYRPRSATSARASAGSRSKTSPTVRSLTSTPAIRFASVCVRPTRMMRTRVLKALAGILERSSIRYASLDSIWHGRTVWAFDRGTMRWEAHRSSKPRGSNPLWDGKNVPMVPTWAPNFVPRMARHRR
jgi:DNA-directed RNA polymerase subunit RPC12/RpoP